MAAKSEDGHSCSGIKKYSDDNDQYDDDDNEIDDDGSSE